MKVYMTMDSSSGGKFWEIEVKGKTFTTRFGKIGTAGRSSSKSFGSKQECDRESKKIIKQKKSKGYSEKKAQKRKKLDESSDEEPSSDDEPPTKKRKITNKKNKNKKPTRKNKRKKKQLTSSEEESEEEESEEEESEDAYTKEDIKNETTLRKMLKESSVLLQDENEKNKFEVVVNNKSYSAVQGKIGTKGKKKTKNFTNKKKAFEAALNLLVDKMRDDWTIVESEGSEEEEDIFDGYNFVLSGTFSKPQKAIKNLITKYGGDIKSNVTKSCDFLLVKDNNVSLYNAKGSNAKKLKIPIISEDYLHDCIDQNKKLKWKKYEIEQEEQEEDDDDDDDDDEDVKMKNKNKNKKKLDDKAENDDESSSDDDDDISSKKSTKKVQKFKGSAPVDEHFNDGDISGWSVYESDGIVYDAMLNQTNIGSNNNKFYKLQVLEKDNSNKFQTWFRWARVGYKGQTKAVPGSKDKCIAEFRKKFYDKTLNDWDDRNDFEKRAKKYHYLPMDYGGGDDSSDDNEEKNDTLKSKLNKDIQNLVKLIFDKDMMEQQMKEIGYDAEKLPLGKVDKIVITKAYQILKDIESELNKGNKDNDDNDDDDDDDDDDDNNNRRSKKRRNKSMRKVNSKRIEELTSGYYTLIPHEFGFKTPSLINTEKLLRKEMKLIESLSEIEVATRLLKDNKNKETEKHPIDSNFDLLKCDMESIDKISDEFKMLKDYVKLTHAETHNRYKLSVETAYSLDRKGSKQRFNKYHDDNNRMLLWHGSRLTNFVGIISQGLRIAPPEAPVTGYMFGKGVYFADMCSKSANYCFTSRENNTGLILLCEVALGDMNEKYQSDYYAADLPQGKLSTKGCGKTTPDPTTYKTLDNGCIVPMGKGVRDNSLRGDLLYNEYIVYNTAQIKMKYLLRLKFDYNDNSGW